MSWFSRAVRGVGRAAKKIIVPAAKVGLTIAAGTLAGRALAVAKQLGHRIGGIKKAGASDSALLSRMGTRKPATRKKGKPAEDLTQVQSADTWDPSEPVPTPAVRRSKKSPRAKPNDKIPKARKPPSAAQLAARAKFTAMVKAKRAS